MEQFIYILFFAGSFFSAIFLTIISISMGMILKENKIDELKDGENVPSTVGSQLAGLLVIYVILFILTILFAALAGVYS